MERTIRPDPLIPDHEVLRKIGGGAYGEIWLARGVTGAMRAVKIVYREDFSDEKTFEREFEGILRFEPISREHGGFVNILHVGRAEGKSPFYYYVMELGDDAYHDDREINPVEYEPRTIRTDVLRANGTPLEVQFCIETGKRLAEALGELHDRGLTHRDVKPSNVIFVDGKPKLADIGLVAVKDQRTFVGTEGFVPPEGPGSDQADIYSLGKVLYEMATGMDRLQFPELPNLNLGAGSQKKWIRLNRVICDVCEPRLHKRKITSGHELAETLGRLEQGRRPRKKIPRQAQAGFAVLALLLLWASQLWIEQTWGTHVIEGQLEPLPAEYVLVKVLSSPDGAQVFDQNGQSLGPTPVTLPNLEVGTSLVLTLQARGYRDLEVDREVVNHGSQVMIVDDLELDLFSPPRTGERWTDALGNLYEPRGAGLPQHRSVSHVTLEDWSLFSEVREGEVFDPIVVSYDEEELVAVPEKWAQEYAKWLMLKCLDEGYFEQYSELDLTKNRQLVADFDYDFPEEEFPPDTVTDEFIRPFHILVRPIPYAVVVIESEPSGAYLYLDEIPVGVTPYQRMIIPGEVRLRLEYGGHKALEKELVLPEKGRFEEKFVLKRNKSLIFGQRWQNSLKMVFEPVGDDLMAAIWETPSAQFRTFLTETGTEAGGALLSEDPLVPVVGVTRAQSEAFCKWLTQKEQPDLIPNDFDYRLPTDREWSEMVGIHEVGDNLLLRELETANRGVFPWGSEFPPSRSVGNYADQSADQLGGPLIPQYRDGFAQIAPVAQYPANQFGLFDLGGNVQEWVSENYLNENLGVLRGGSFRTYSEQHLESRSRIPLSIETSRDDIGFRVVLAKNAKSPNPQIDDNDQN